MERVVAAKAPFLFALLVPAATVAGCLDGGSDRSTESLDDARAGEAVSLPQAGSGSPDNTTEPVPRLVPVAFDGRLGREVRVCENSLPDRCHSLGAEASDNGVFLKEMANHTIQGGSLLLAWTAETPATNELDLMAMTMGPDGMVMLGTARGRSPLTLEVQPRETPLDPDEVIHLVVGMANAIEQGSAYAEARTGQRFHLEGNLTLMP